MGGQRNPASVTTSDLVLVRSYDSSGTLVEFYSRWSDIQALIGGGGGGISDGDKGDITVSDSGEVWTIDNGVITNAKQANMATQTFKGRNTAGSGAPEDLTISQVRTLLLINNLNNTSDVDKPISSATQTALDTKVDKVSGKGLSENDYVDADKDKVDLISVTQLVDLDALETRVNELDAAVVLKGTWDASAGTFPGGGVAQAGWSYIVSVAGTVNAQVFVSGDRIIAITDNASTTTFANNWFKADYTDAVLSVVGLTGAVSKAGLQTALDISNTNTGDETATTIKTKLGTTTVGESLNVLTNPSAITFLRVNANNSVSALSAANFLTAIGATTVGGNLFTLGNPGAITFLRVNADNTVTALSAANFLTAIGAQAAGTYLTAASIVDAITDGVTDKAPSQNAVFDALALKAALASPTFTGTVVMPTNSTTNAAFNIPAGTLKTTAAAGDREFDGTNHYTTIDTTNGRGILPVIQRFRLAANSSAIGPAIANFFGTTSNIPLVASAEYEIEIFLFFTKTTASTITWTLTNSAAPTAQNIYFAMSPITGVVAPPGSATELCGEYINDTTAARAFTTGSLTTAVNHYAYFKIFLSNGTGTSLKIQVTSASGTVTPLRNSRWICQRLPAANTGTFAT